MIFPLNFSANIVVPICTEWLTIQDYGQLECCSEELWSLLLRLSEKYISKFRSLLEWESDYVPMSASSVKWLDRRSWNSNTLLKFTSLSSLMVKKEIDEMPNPCQLVACLKRVKRMDLGVILNDANMLFLCRSCENLEELYVSCIMNWTDHPLDNLPCISRLTSLRLRDEPRSLCSLLRQAVSLQCLRIDYGLHSASLVPSILVHCRSLTSIQLHLRGKVNRSYFLMTFHCAKLCTALNFPFDRPLVLKSLLVFLGGPQLKSLSLSCKDCQGYIEVAALAPQVTSLTLYGPITSTMLKVIQSRFTQLKTLDLKNCSCLEGNEEKFAQFQLSSPHVSEVLLYDINVSDHAFTSLVSSITLPITSKVRHLNLNVCSTLTDSTLLCLPQLCPVLTSLDLYGLTNISDSGLLPLLKIGRLQVLNINKTSLTDITLLHLAEYCWELRELYMYGVQHSAAALLQLVRCCRRLKKLKRL